MTRSLLVAVSVACWGCGGGAAGPSLELGKPAILSTTPASPAGSVPGGATPTFLAAFSTKGGGSTVEAHLFLGAACETPIAQITVPLAAAGSFSLAVPLASAAPPFAERPYTVRLSSAGAADSPCSDPMVYAWVPAEPAPSSLGTSPTSPGRQGAPDAVVGQAALAPSGVEVRVRLHTGATPCERPLGDAPVPIGQGGPFSLPVPPAEAVAPDSAATFWVAVTDSLGNATCSTPVRWVYLATVATPTVDRSEPRSPSNQPGLRLFGTAGDGTALGVAPDLVELFLNDLSCTGSPVTGGGADVFATTGIPVSPHASYPGGSVTISARSVDAAGNVSGCSDPFAFVFDFLPPGAPEILRADGPGPTPTVAVRGVEAGATVAIYSSSTLCTSGCCSDTPVATGPAASFAAGAAAATGEDVFLQARQADAAGNWSTCSVPFAYATTCRGYGLPPAACGTLCPGLQPFGSGMIGCPGTGTFLDRDAACPAGTRACSTTQWGRRKNALPQHHYWVDAWVYFVFVSYNNCQVNGGGGNNCALPGQGPPKICSAFGPVDPEGNVCHLECGDFGLSCEPDAAGTLCCSPCSPSASAVQLYDSFMAGCGGSISRADAVAAGGTTNPLCAPGCRTCTAAEYVAHHGDAAPQRDYWLQDALGRAGTFSGAASPVTCSAHPANPLVCAQGSMLACVPSPTAGAPDADGNRCDWSHCAYLAGDPVASPGAADDFLGGCPSVNPAFGIPTAGALCCCD